jgi:hypothetical protein
MCSIVVILPRFDGVAKCGIYYSMKGEQDDQATKKLDARVQTGSGAAGQEQWQTDESGSLRVRDQRQRPVSLVQAIGGAR